MGYTLKSPYRFPYSLRDYLDPRHYLRVIRCWSQRARRGYADADLWSFDAYLAGILRSALPYFRNASPPHPSVIFLLAEDNARGMSLHGDALRQAQARWDAMIDEIIASLEAVYGDEADPGPEDRQRLVAALCRFAENFTLFWD